MDGPPIHRVFKPECGFLPGMYVCVPVEEAVKESVIPELQREVLRTLDAKAQL
ncbi:hypothetical protein [Sinorhizobium meliloti]|uniref:hypothetical protein n=1 Tax=Rhizobium meliloti TaxID=382 RepID=UPI0013E40F3F|nr:hypothetical protein [Sinorhizobium meliloti]